MYYIEWNDKTMQNKQFIITNIKEDEATRLRHLIEDIYHPYNLYMRKID